MKVKIAFEASVIRDIPDSYFKENPEHNEDMSYFSPHMLSCSFEDFKQMCLEKEKGIIARDGNIGKMDIDTYCSAVYDLDDRIIAEE